MCCRGLPCRLRVRDASRCARHQLPQQQHGHSVPHNIPCLCSITLLQRVYITDASAFSLFSEYVYIPKYKTLSVRFAYCSSSVSYNAGVCTTEANVGLFRPICFWAISQRPAESPKNNAHAALRTWAPHGERSTSRLLGDSPLYCRRAKAGGNTSVYSVKEENIKH